MLFRSDWGVLTGIGSNKSHGSLFISRCPCARKGSGSVSRMMYYMYVQYKSTEKYPGSLLIYCVLSVVHIIHPKFKFFQGRRVGRRHSTYNEGFLKILIHLCDSVDQNIIFVFQIITHRVLTQFRITRTTMSTKKKKFKIFLNFKSLNSR